MRQAFDDRAAVECYACSVLHEETGIGDEHPSPRCSSSLAAASPILQRCGARAPFNLSDRIHVMEACIQDGARQSGVSAPAAVASAATARVGAG